MRSYSFIIVVLIIMVVGVSRADTPGNRIIRRLGLDNGLSGREVGGIVQDNNGLIWLSTWYGLNCYDGYEFYRVVVNPGDNTSVSSNHFRDILLTANGGHIACHTADNIHLFDLSTYTFTDASPSRIDSLLPLMGKNQPAFIDRQGNRWWHDRTGVFTSGGVHYPAVLLEGTENMNVRSLMVDREENLWVGLRDTRAVNIYSPDLKLKRSIPLPSVPYCIYQTANGDVWVGCKPGSLLKIGGEPIATEAVYDMIEDRYGNLWMATFGDGIKVIINPLSPHPEPVKTSTDGKIRKLALSADGSLLLAASNEGLWAGRIDPTNPANTRFVLFKHIKGDSGSLASDNLISLTVDTKGNIYIATESSGIDVISEDSILSGSPRFGRLSSASPYIVNGLAIEADTMLFIASNNHVTICNPNNGTTTHYRSQFWADSCYFTESTPVMMPDRRWVVASEHGVFIATNHNLFSRGFTPPLVVMTVAREDEDERLWPAGYNKIQLTEQQRNVTIKFAALDYGNNRDILYRTRLDGSSWADADISRTVTLFNLSPGSHLLEIQSTDRYGRWVDNTIGITIEVQPKWHETVLARVLFVIMAFLIICAVIYTIIYIRRVNSHRRELLDKYMSLMARIDAPATADDIYTDGTISTNIKAVDEQFLNRVKRYIEENIANADANIDDMAAAAATSRSTLNRRLRSLMGISAAQLLKESRLQRARQLLADPNNNLSMTDIALQCGYTDPSYFRRLLNHD